MSSPNRRKETDVMKLMMSDYEVTMPGDSMTEFTVKFRGPPNSPYDGGVWKVRVELPQAYPYKSPSIGFVNKIFHPNVDEASGSVCLDVINQTWSPMFDLVNVFAVFLPQLLLYPNPSDPLNGEAAALLMQNLKAYQLKVQEHVKKYASQDVKLDGEEEPEPSEESPVGQATLSKPQSVPASSPSVHTGSSTDSSATDESPRSDFDKDKRTGTDEPEEQLSDVDDDGGLDGETSSALDADMEMEAAGHMEL